MLYVVAVLYLIPTIRGTVVTIEDVDKISALFDTATKACLEGVEDADAGPEPLAREDEQLVQSTSELRRLYVLARARLASFEVEVVERLARARALAHRLRRRARPRPRSSKSCFARARRSPWITAAG